MGYLLTALSQQNPAEKINAEWAVQGATDSDRGSWAGQICGDVWLEIPTGW